MLFEEMKKKGYRMFELEMIDSSLKEFGITEGGQLDSITTEQMRKKVDADLFCYGTVVDYRFKSAVAFSQKKVEIKLKLMDSRTDKVLFEDTEIGITSQAGPDAAGALAINTAGKIIKAVKDSAKDFLPGQRLKEVADLTDQVADVDLKAETQEAIQKFLNKFSKE